MIKYYILIIFAVILQSCSTKVDSLSNYNVDETFADLSTTNLFTEYYSKHQLQTTLTAPLAEQYTSAKQPYMEFPKGVEVIFYDDDKKEQGKLTADYAVYYSKKKLWEARKNVVVVNEAGNTLKTEQLFGDENRKKIFSVKKVTVIDPDGSVIVGKQGFESDMTFRNYKFLDVNGVVNLSNEYKEQISEENNQNENDISDDN